MPIWLRWILAVGILVVLVIIFVVSFVLYRKTPAPKGCEEFEKPSEAKCHGCKETGCHFNLYYNDIESQVKEEMENLLSQLLIMVLDLMLIQLVRIVVG